ncbi:hypothetical protein CBS101457_002494 [Exobasidium rhododendri]|nr:hypothetical protein CBS101457_002494 [Exobasidium rhododendri]
MAATAMKQQYVQPTHRQQPSRAGCSRPRQDSVYDHFYGHREISELSESVISALFACPLDSASSSVNALPSSAMQNPTPRLAEFIAYALHRTRLPEEITFQALFLLRRLKSRFPAAKGSSGHRLFISALMLASKSSCDDTYSNKSWTVVSQGLFTLREVNQMERELFGYLAFKVNVEIEELTVFRDLLMNGSLPTDVECCSPNPASIDSNSSDSQSTAATSVSVHCHRSNSPASTDAVPVSIRCSSQASPRSEPMEVSSATTTQVVSNMSPGFQYHPYRQGVTYSSNDTDLSPCSESLSSSRGSFSSASGYSMTPSPSNMSYSEASSSQNTPPTPPVEDLYSEGSHPWDGSEAKVVPYHDEPAGTYEAEVHQYMHPRIKQSSAAYTSKTRSRHPFQRTTQN